MQNFLRRPYKTTDLDAILDLFHHTVHSINIQDYSPEQVNMWAPDNINKEKWAQQLQSHCTYVVETDNRVVGFGDMTKDGCLDHIYVDKDFQGQGIASLILQAIEQKAHELGLAAITTESSITAKPFFEKRGFCVLKRQEKILNGITFINYTMKKEL